MKDELIQKNQSNTETFQKYPKNYQENKHYRSVKEKLMTSQDDQQIIKFPFTAVSIQSRKSSGEFNPTAANRKVEKYKGKKFETVPMRTISYSTPINYAKTQEFQRSVKTSRKSQEENKFNSKNTFSNMKKLKDLRKNNYKNRLTSMEKKQNPQKIIESDDNKLDLFKLTSTNFNYKKRVSSECPQDVEMARKFAKTQGTNRNVIKFNNSPKSNKKKNTINQTKQIQQIEEKINTEDQFLILLPVVTENTKPTQRSRQKKIIHHVSTKNFYSNRYSDGDINRLQDQQGENQQHMDNFVRYSQAMIQSQNQLLQRGFTKLRNEINNKKEHSQQNLNFDHIPKAFRASFRIKHVEDNKNILLTTIKKKASTMNRNQLVEYLQKVVK